MSYAKRICPGCGLSYTPKRHDQVHCNTACNTAAKNLAAARAKAIYRELYHWAAGGKNSGLSFGDVSKMARKWVREDREKGVAPPPLPARLETIRLNENYEARRAEAVRLLAAREGCERNG